jgi:hypothetical protein
LPPLLQQQQPPQNHFQHQPQQQQHQHQQPRASGNLALCDSTLLRLLSSTLAGAHAAGSGQAGGAGQTLSSSKPQRGSSPWSRQEASDAAQALLHSLEGVSAAAAERAGSIPSGQVQQDPASGAAASLNLIAADSGLLHMLNQRLRDAATSSGGAAAAARFAAEAEGGQGGSGRDTSAAPPASPFAAAAAQALPGLPPSLLSGSGGGGGRPPLGFTLPSPAPSTHGTRQPSVDAFSGGLAALGLAGSQGRAPLSTAEFLRLCSLPGADLLTPTDH